MTVCEAPALALPAPFDRADIGAWTQYGKRQLSFTLRDPGELFRNRFKMAWVEVVEEEPMRGEPLSVIATRRVGDGYARESFTEKARTQLKAMLLPVVARAGFDLWHLHRALRDDPAACLQHAREAARLVAWWEERADLADMHRNGDLTFKPVELEPLGTRQRQVLVVSPGYSRQTELVGVMASAWFDREQVGWLTNSGELVPNEESLG